MLWSCFVFFTKKIVGTGCEISKMCELASNVESSISGFYRFSLTSPIYTEIAHVTVFSLTLRATILTCVFSLKYASNNSYFVHNVQYCPQQFRRVYDPKHCDREFLKLCARRCWSVSTFFHHVKHCVPHFLPLLSKTLRLLWNIVRKNFRVWSLTVALWIDKTKTNSSSH